MPPGRSPKRYGKRGRTGFAVPRSLINLPADELLRLQSEALQVIQNLRRIGPRKWAREILKINSVVVEIEDEYNRRK